MVFIVINYDDDDDYGGDIVHAKLVESCDCSCVQPVVIRII